MRLPLPKPGPTCSGLGLTSSLGLGELPWVGGVPSTGGRNSSATSRDGDQRSQCQAFFFFPKALGFSPSPAPRVGVGGMGVGSATGAWGGGSLLRNITVAASTPPVHPRHVRLLALVPVLKSTAAVLPERLLCAHFTGLRPVYTVPPNPKRGCQPCGFHRGGKQRFSKSHGQSEGQSGGLSPAPDPQSPPQTPTPSRLALSRKQMLFPLSRSQPRSSLRAAACLGLSITFPRPP